MLEIGRKIWERERERALIVEGKKKKKNAMVKQISRQIS